MKRITLFLLLLIGNSAMTQEFSTDLLKGIKPRNIGPAGMSGRVTSIDVQLSDTNIIYVGTASGGLWKSTSGGIKWMPIFDKEVTASIGAVAIQQSNPSIIWVGTGEGNPRNSLNGGYGIYKSLDGGRSWKCMGLEQTRHIHRVIIHPNNPDIVYVGAIGSPWGEHPERGVFKTMDGGKTWKKILFANNSTGVADMVMAPNNPNKLLVALWEHKREPWFFNSGGEGSGLYITHDGGDHWKKITPDDGLPKGHLGRMGLAIAKNRPNIIYALVEAKKNALFKSEDGGFSWHKINAKKDIGNRPFYYSDIFVDPENENRVYSIFTFVNVSEDGGRNFSRLMPAYKVNNGVHPDHHAWWIHPNNGQFMIDGNDGGLNITKDGGKTWQFIGNLPVAQFYHINVDNEYPYNVYGGMQDNGSWRGPAHVWREQGIRNSYWQEISFGDGFDVVPDPDDSRFGYSMSQKGQVRRYDWKTGNNYIVQPTPPNADIRLRFNWNAAIAQDPFENSTVYFGSQFVHKSEDKGLTWQTISDDLTTNDPDKQKQTESGGLTMDATGAENYCSILVIEPSIVEKDMLWVGTDDGRVHYTRNGGNDWIAVGKNIKYLPKGSWITQIKASKSKKGEALLVANDYRRFNYEPYVYRTRDYGKTWQRIVDGDDVKSFALSVVEDPENPNLMFLGTDDGLRLSLNAGVDWQKWNEDFPTVSVKDLVIHPRENDLIIGTFGRAAWILDDIRPLRQLAGNMKLLDKEVALFKSPDAYLAAYQQPTGSRFGADAMYNGENRKKGAMITYYLKERKKTKSTVKQVENEDENIDKREAVSKKSGVQRKDSVQFDFYDGNRLFRTLKYKTPEKAGFHRIFWQLDEKGSDVPSRKMLNSKVEPKGIKVKPGRYKVVVHFGNGSDSTMVTVKSDPRLKVDANALNQVYNHGKKLENLTQIAADAVKQLMESKNVVQRFRTEMITLDKEEYEEQIEESKKIIKTIDSIVSLYLGKEDKRQGIVQNRDPHFMQRIKTAKTYVRSRKMGITKTELGLIELAEDHLKTALGETNAFFETQWKAYKEKQEALALTPFKEIKTFTIK